MKKNRYSPKFSVCIPVYNADQYLVECVESVLNQTVCNYEIILVDDGSTDNSPKICDDFASQYPFIKVFHKRNEGPLLARHDAVRASSGQYLMFLDSDDVYNPLLLQRMEETIHKTSADMIVFDLISLSIDRNEVLYTESLENEACFEGNSKREFLKYFVYHASMNSMCRKCIHREIYSIDADYSLYKGLIQGEDKLVSIHCVDRANKIVYLKEALYGYRVNPQSTSFNMTIKNYKDIQMVREELAKYMDLWKMPNKVKEELFTSRLVSTFNCVISIVLQFKKGKITRHDFYEAIAYIASDKQFLDAYEVSGGRVKLFKKIICYCVIRKKYRLLSNLAWGYALMVNRK